MCSFRYYDDFDYFNQYQRGFSLHYLKLQKSIVIHDLFERIISTDCWLWINNDAGNCKKIEIRFVFLHFFTPYYFYSLKHERFLKHILRRKMVRTFVWNVRRPAAILNHQRVQSKNRHRIGPCYLTFQKLSS